MVSVTSENFAELLPEIEANISSAFCVALDTEFSGLNLANASRESRFDGAKQRYNRLRQNVQEASLLQLGLCCFIPCSQEPSEGDGERNDMSYQVVSYNIVFAPADVGLLAFKPKNLQAEWGSMRFLNVHGFDLNKVVQCGVPYMKIRDMERCAEMLSGGIGILRHSDFDNDALRLAHTEADRIQSFTATLMKNTTGAAGLKELEFKDLLGSPVVLHYLLREIYPDAWTVATSWNSLVLHFVGPEKRCELESNDRELEKWLIKEYTAVGRIFAKLVKEKKLLQDLLFLIDAFYDNLPKSYEELKSLVKELFPNLYDGKVITNVLSRNERINFYGHYEAPGLVELFQTLSSPKTIFRYAPHLVHDIRHAHYAVVNRAHEAGYDAFVSGAVFLYSMFAISADKIADMRTRALQVNVPQKDRRPPVPIRDVSTTCHSVPPMTLRQMPLQLASVKDFRGLLYLHLSADRFLNLFGADEQADRSKAWIRLVSSDPAFRVVDSNLVKQFLDCCVYEHCIKSPNEIVVACTTADRAQKLADFARTSLGVTAEIFDSASLKEYTGIRERVPRGKVFICTLVVAATAWVVFHGFYQPGTSVWWRLQKAIFG